MLRTWVTVTGEEVVVALEGDVVREVARSVRDPVSGARRDDDGALSPVWGELKDRVQVARASPLYDDTGTGLRDRSRRPKASPTAAAPEVEKAIVEARKKHPRRGPRKLHAALQRSNPKATLPSVGTFARVLKRNGLVRPRRRAKRTPPSSSPLQHATASNARWCIDFKGAFELGATRCYPPTVTDAYSRYLVACVALPNTRTETVQRASAIFDAFGFPDRIRSDNGSPFASPAPCGLSSSCPSGGCAWASRASESSQASRSKTVVMNGFISR